MMGSAAFLLVYAVVNAGHLRVLQANGRQCADRVAVAAHVPGGVRHAGYVHLPAATASNHRARRHRGLFVPRRSTISKMDRAAELISISSAACTFRNARYARQLSLRESALTDTAGRSRAPSLTANLCAVSS